MLKSNTVELQELDIFHFLFNNPRRPFEAEKTALIDAASGLRVPRGEIRDRTISIAYNLQKKFHFQRRDVAAIFALNNIDYPMCVFGVLAAGGAVTTVNSGYTASELSGQLVDSNAKYLFISPELAQTALDALDLTGSIPRHHVFVLNGSSVSALNSVETLLEPPNSHFQPVQLNKNEIKHETAFLCYSSGTTGKSKGVELTHWNIVANVQQVMNFEGNMDPGREVWVGVLPFFHIYGLNLSLHTAFAYKIPVVVIKKFEFMELLSYIQKYRISYAHLVPPILLGLAKHPVVSKFDLSSLHTIISGAAPLSAELSIAVSERLGGNVRQGYGMTEASPVTHFSPLAGAVPGSVGILMPNCEAKLVTEDGREAGLGESGELFVRGPNVMKGYLNNSEANKITLVSGFLRTGDLARVDEKGNFYIVDRLKELIKYKGFQVAPAELEALLLTHPSIADAAVVRKYKEETEVPQAFVVLKPQCQATSSEIEAFVAGKVAPHKRLRGGVVFVSEIPKSASGKILRRKL